MVMQCVNDIHGSDCIRVSLAGGAGESHEQAGDTPRKVNTRWSDLDRVGRVAWPLLTVWTGSDTDESSHPRALYQ